MELIILVIVLLSYAVAGAVLAFIMGAMKHSFDQFEIGLLAILWPVGSMLLLVMQAATLGSKLREWLESNRNTNKQG